MSVAKALVEVAGVAAGAASVGIWSRIDLVAVFILCSLELILYALATQIIKTMAQS
jgi:hypothetical protein